MCVEIWEPHCQNWIPNIYFNKYFSRIFSFGLAVLVKSWEESHQKPKWGGYYMSLVHPPLSHWGLAGWQKVNQRYRIILKYRRIKFYITLRIRISRPKFEQSGGRLTQKLVTGRGRWIVVAREQLIAIDILFWNPFLNSYLKQILWKYFNLSF